MPRTIPAINLVDVELQDVVEVQISRAGDGSSDLHVQVAYRVRTDSGTTHHGGGYSLTLAPGVAAELAAWLQDRVIPGINEQEGMV